MRYYSVNKYLRDRFGEKVQRISLNAGFKCPNFAAEKGEKGCIYCNEYAFSRFAGTGMSLEEQIESSISSLKEKRGIGKFIAYFQNATGTNADPGHLKEVYDTIRKYPDIVGLIISTRPDCVDKKKLDLIASYKSDYEVWIEYGIQSAHDRTLEAIKRGHNFSDSVKAVKMTKERGIRTGAHIILGLPGENRESMIATAEAVNNMGMNGVKLHALHVLKNTELEAMYLLKRIDIMSESEYVSAACDFMEHLSPECVMLRLVSDADSEYLIAPGWMGHKLRVINEIEREFEKRNTRQGSACRGSGAGPRRVL